MAPLALIGAWAVLAAGAVRADELADAQARVEALYVAGSLPEALDAAREGLWTHPLDPVLLRRACQLALALRVPEVARDASDRLGSLVRSEALAAWRAESQELAREVGGLEAREREVASATHRARAASLGAIGVLGVLLLVLVRGLGLAKRDRPLPEAGSGR